MDSRKPLRTSGVTLPPTSPPRGAALAFLPHPLTRRQRQRFRCEVTGFRRYKVYLVDTSPSHSVHMVAPASLWMREMGGKG